MSSQKYMGTFICKEIIIGHGDTLKLNKVFSLTRRQGVSTFCQVMPNS